MPPVLRRGARGEAVRRLQTLLRRHGFSPGAVDGIFGPATEAAVVAFQRAHGLLADGVVGPRTWRALAAADGKTEAERTGGDPAPAVRRVDVALVAEMFPHTPLDPIRRHLPVVLGALEAAGLGDKPGVLLALATIRAEAEGFEPVAERVSRYNTSPGGHPFDLYDWRRDLGNRGPRDGWRYRGRGFVQLTGRANYARTGRRLGLGDLLVREPDRALEPELAARILAAFLAERRDALVAALHDGDLVRARRLVNGGTHGLARFRAALLAGDRLLDDPVWPTGSIYARVERASRRARQWA